MTASTASPDPRRAGARAFSREILPAVSRTFALSIRLLPGELGDAVCTAYLLCRAADTVEDDPRASAADKAALLDALLECLDSAAAADCFPSRARAVSGDPAHLRLVRNADLVFVAYRGLRDGPRERIRHWVREMIAGMRKFVLAYPNGIRLQTLAEYEEYCYYVAGTVGYMLTDLWRAYSATIDPARYEVLRGKSAAFGRALQTVNILKDVATDAVRENSIYVPQDVLAAHGSAHEALVAGDAAPENRAALRVLVDLAWRDLDEATAYLLALPRRAIPIRLFCALPLLFAYATLRELTRDGERPARAVVKISRREVKSITALAMLAAPSNSALAALVRRARARPVSIGS
jgi:farnesyl-diphosphate farnesyltransferase